MERQIRGYLVSIAKQYAHIRGIALTTVARRLHGTEYFFRDFAKGKKTITLKKLQEMLQAFADNWPADRPFPEPPALVKPERRGQRPFSRKADRRRRNESPIQTSPGGTEGDMGHEHYP